ncbi:MAG: DUF4011 domain-containing protein [Clostridia bacterium]|nr:DUF4011 domain-containing protein [Clostridia bacterium]
MTELTEKEKGKISFHTAIPRYAGYCDCFLSTKIQFRLENQNDRSVLLKVRGGESELFLPFEKEAEVGFESAVSLNADKVFSPRFLAENETIRNFTFHADLFCGDEKITSKEAEITALPFDYWEGLFGVPEKVSCFVRPRAFQTARVVKEVKHRLLRCGVRDFCGYENADKSEVKKAVAAFFSAVKEMGFTKSGGFDLSYPSLASPPAVTSARKTDAFRLALFTAACMERAGLHAVLALSKNKVGVGAWLFDSCFLESSFDDLKTVERYLRDDHLAFFNAEDLFTESVAEASDSEERFLRELKADAFDCFVDIARCRTAGFVPCPARGEVGCGLYGESEENTPKVGKAFARQGKEKLWERGLLDFSSRNPLLDFKGKNALQVLAPDADILMKYLSKDGLKLTGGGKVDCGRELLDEVKDGVLRTALSPRETEAVAGKLRRRNREAVEETGAKILFLACGFLKFGAREERKCAPVVLLPVELSRAKGKEGYALTSSGEYFVNLTLVEYLKQEYEINLRGIENSALSVKEILNVFRKETSSMAGWEVSGELYLSTFFFQRFLMWNDLKEHFQEFNKNRAVRALYFGKSQELSAQESEPEAEDMSLPLPSDASQRKALALSKSGKSFVLHGPPGTGKSQTITNMIALALEKGKTVLFVAEKKAAIDVVKRRLDEIGIGDFCLELGSKTDCGEAFKQLDKTLRLKGKSNEEDFAITEEYKRAQKELAAMQNALHEKRKLSLSVHEAITKFFERKSYPDILKMGGDFYESLDEVKFIKARELILSAAAAAKECGGVFNSPFENFNLKEYSPAVRDRAVFAGRALLGEAAHFKCFLSLVLDFFKQKISSFTEERANALAKVLSGLLSGKYRAYFEGVTAEEFSAFRSANLRLDSCLAFYEKHFKILLNLEEEFTALEEFLKSGGDYKLNRTALSLRKRLERVALRPLSEKDIPKYIEAAVGVFSARKQIAASPLAKSFIDRGGRISEKKRTEFLAPLKELSAACAFVFTEWAPELFFDGCVRAVSGCAEPLFSGYLSAMEEFFKAEESYLVATGAKRDRFKGEDILGYFSAKAAALLENADLLSGRCAYKAAEEELINGGMKFIGDALESGSLSPDDALGGFEKSLMEHFLSVNIPRDLFLSRMTSASVESEKEKFALLYEKQTAYARRRLRETLISRLPERGEFQEELSLLFRLEKGARRGRLRTLLLEAPKLVKRVCPCLLLSPDAAAQYLAPKADEYDLVIFDEASQMTTAEAIPALARAKQAVIVGDNRQLPPTSFFRTSFFGEEDEEESLESVLDEAIAAGFEERSLLWHYRSRHESLIAFSNAAYYENRLNTFPSPVASESRVKLKKVGGVYDRGNTKRNRREAEALAEEVIRRLLDPVLSRQSIGVVTFSNVQREEIERILTREIAKRSLEEIAYGGREPLFVKNLENVQGDERDVILFSVCYGFDKEGRLSYNFGALNRAGGWRRLNVACSRAREEMLVFSSISAGDIDLNRTSSRGVAGLKAFLEFAEKGRAAPLPFDGAKRRGIGKYLAEELSAYGYECRAGVGASNFKIEVAVLDPKDKNRYILGILSDGAAESSAADGAALLPALLKRGGWNLMTVSEVSYFNNPKREIKRIKDRLDELTGANQESGLTRYIKPYRHVRDTGGKTLAFVTDGKNDNEIKERLCEIVAREEPISRAFLKKRCMESFGIVKWGLHAESRLDEIITRSAFPFEKVGGVEYFYKNPKSLLPVKFRIEGKNKRRSAEEDFTPFETAALIKGILEEKVTLYDDELASLVAAEYGVKETDAFSSFVSRTLAYGEGKGMFRRSLSGRISLA